MAGRAHVACRRTSCRRVPARRKTGERASSAQSLISHRNAVSRPRNCPPMQRNEMQCKGNGALRRSPSYRPPGQPVQPVELLASAYCPLTHAVQLPAADVALYVPARQTVQGTAAPGENWPAAHTAQVMPPVVATNLRGVSTAIKTGSLSMHVHYRVKWVHQVACSLSRWVAAISRNKPQPAATSRNQPQPRGRTINPSPLHPPPSPPQQLSSPNNVFANPASPHTYCPGAHVWHAD